MRMPVSNGFTRGGDGSASPVARAGQPPAAGLLRVRGITHIDDHQELVIILVARREIVRTGREIGELTIVKRQIVHAARMRTRCVEVRQLLRMRRIGHVIYVHAGIGLARRLDLVRHRQRRAGQAERVAACEHSLRPESER